MVRYRHSSTVDRRYHLHYLYSIHPELEIAKFFLRAKVFSENSFFMEKHVPAER